MLRTDDFNKSQLVLTGWRYGQEYGGYMAALLIMSCLANRVRKGWGSWSEIIDRHPLFSAEEKIPSGYPNIWDPAFVRLLHEVDAIYDGSAADLAKGAMYWADLRRIERDWFRTAILDRPEDHPRIVDMNSLSLFK